jgi:hypothetical protein
VRLPPRRLPWRNKKFDENELTKAVATQARAQNALEQYRISNVTSIDEIVIAESK